MSDLDWPLIGKLAMAFAIIFASALVISELLTRGFDKLVKALEHRRENKAFVDKLKEEEKGK